MKQTQTATIFTFTADADRREFIASMIRDLGFTPSYSTATTANDDAPPHYLVAVRLPGFMFGLMRRKKNG